ncbi:MAG: adenylate/guanylate cyclase domain-containing protein [Marmoricola sp.]
MRAWVIRRLFERLGCRYWWFVALAQAGAGVLVASTTSLAMASFWRPPLHSLIVITAVAAGLAGLSIMTLSLKPARMAGQFWEWRANPNPDPAETVALWNFVSSAVFRNFRNHSCLVLLVAVVPGCAFAAIDEHAGWLGFGAMIFACVVPGLYGLAISFSIGELLARPMLEVIATRLPDDFELDNAGLPIAKRLRIALPTYTMAAAALVAAIVGHGRGAGAMTWTIAVVMIVGIALSTELTVLLGDAISTPIEGLRAQVDRVRRGDYTARIPVLTNDEFGELARDINVMTRGLQEREEIREAFGTYMDRGVVELILSGEFPPEGVEVVCSILFCDVRDFTSYAERATAPEVIATLNAMFSVIVPIVERHGGHVDKFLGDGLLAVFGAPEYFVDHADRAVAAACEIVEAVAQGPTGLRVHAGVNTGPVVAGPLGGAGRLNFSVIGDAVNVAARVEAATRETGDDVLFTDATRRMFARRSESVSRGALPLKGKAEPLELFAPVRSRDRQESPQPLVTP